MTMCMIRDRHFCVHIGNKNSRRRTLKNGVPQGSVLAPALFNIYTYNIPVTVSKKYIYADDIALATIANDFKPIEHIQHVLRCPLIGIKGDIKSVDCNFRECLKENNLLNL